MRAFERGFGALAARLRGEPYPIAGDRAARPLDRRRPGPSLLTAVFAVATIFVAVPVILYEQFREADRDKAALLHEVAQEQARLITEGLEPALAADDALDDPSLGERIARLAGPNVHVKLLFRPDGNYDAGAFFFVASHPEVGPESIAAERRWLHRQGVLAHLGSTCAKAAPLALRYRPARGAEEVLTSVVPVLTSAGCWAVVTSNTSRGFVGSSLGKSYWQTDEVRVAALIYIAMAIVVLTIFLRIWRSLRRFSWLARQIRQNAGTGALFADQNTVPELAPVAEAFDTMVAGLRKLSTAIENSPNPVVITDAQGTIEYVNPVFTETTGYSANEVVGRSFRMLRTGRTPLGTFRSMWEKVSSGGVWRGEIHSRKRDGEWYWVHLSVSSIRDSEGTVTHFVGILEDMTERKRAEMELREAKQQAEHANRSKSEFLAHVSHELRTPLNAIMGFAEIIAREMYGPCNVPSYLEYAGHIHESGHHLISVINDLLDLSKLEAGKMELREETVDGGEVAGAALRLVKERAANNGLTLTVDVAQPVPLLTADPRMLKQMLLNLLANSVKFTPQGGRVSLSIERHDGSGVRFVVADTGIGIAEKDIPKVMEPYGQAGDGVYRRGDGTGLGLPLVKRMAELHRASVSIESKLGQGTRVSLVFPPERAVHAPPCRSLPDRPGESGSGSEACCAVRNPQ